jgi:glutathione S-transferase
VTPILHGIRYSPWSEKARWALDHHRIHYREIDYVPMLSEPLVRLHTRNFTGRITVPILVADGAVVPDSYAIAAWADDSGSGRPLIPVNECVDLEYWVEESERALDAGRALATERSAGDPEALAAMLPGPRPLRRPLMPVARLGVRLFRHKYRFDDRSLDEHRKILAEVVAELDRALADRGHLIGEHFSFADIAMATVLQMVRPVDDRYLRIPGPIRVTMSNPDLAREHPRALEWRDSLYHRYR